MLNGALALLNTQLPRETEIEGETPGEPTGAVSEANEEQAAPRVG